jgi:hypothetical protein
LCTQTQTVDTNITSPRLFKELNILKKHALKFKYKGPKPLTVTKDVEVGSVGEIEA